MARAREEQVKRLFALVPKDNAPRAPVEGLRVHALPRVEDALKLALGDRDS